MPAIVPSLYRAFEPERKALTTGLSDSKLTMSQVVSEARRALDRTGIRYTDGITNPQLQKTGLWLVEIIKVGAGTLDQSIDAEIVWHEVPREKKRGWIGQTAFFAAAAALAFYGFLEGSRIAVISVATLAFLRLLDRENLSAIKARLPFLGQKHRLEDKSGRAVKAEAQIQPNIAAYVDGLAEALKTADHILLRLSEPEAETHWRDDQRLMSLVQGLLEAEQVNDGDFALKLIGQELETILQAEGVRRIDYSKKTAQYFDILPGLGTDKPKLAAPALMAGDQVIRRGTVWGSEDG